LPAPYYHVVFNLPHSLGGTIGLAMVLHTWGQNLNQHLHVHCLVSGGALATDGRWIHPRRGFLFPVEALSAAFRGKFLDALKQAFEHSSLTFARSTSVLADARGRLDLFAACATPWVVYTKQPFAGHQQVLQYLGQYTHRVALTNRRLVSIGEHTVAFCQELTPPRLSAIVNSISLAATLPTRPLPRPSYSAIFVPQRPAKLAPSAFNLHTAAL
jgi:hypothetical protein